MTTYKKKLIEVALPLEDINREAARENYIYKGNPSAIHKWWAQRPLAACRAVLFASLVDDPSERVSELLADGAKCKAAAKVLDARTKTWKEAAAFSEKAKSAGISAPPPGSQPKLEDIIAELERERLFDIIRELVKWENSKNERVLKKARAEILRSTGGKPPAVCDPFCGAGSIPLEAQRLGLDGHASDLNPVPVLITKALTEIPVMFAGRRPVNPESRGDLDRASSSRTGAGGLVDDIRYYGQWIRDETEKMLDGVYPPVRLPKEHGGGEAPVIAWLWTRTVASPNPAAKGAHVPLVRSFWLSTKAGKKTWVVPIIDHNTMTYYFEVRTGTGEPMRGTVGRAGATCLLTGSPIALEHIREEGRKGNLGQRLLAIVALSSRGRIYVAPTPDHERAAQIDPPENLLETSLPEKALGFRVQAYGMTQHRDLYTPRQLVGLSTLCGLIQSAASKIQQDSDGDEEYAKAVATYLAFALDKTAEYNCTLVPWYTKEDRPKGVFARHALPMVWDFAEVNPLGSIGGTYAASIRVVAEALEGCPTTDVGNIVVKQADATRLQETERFIFCTDPPYYDNIGYADLADFFYVWLRKSLLTFYPDILSTVLTPKEPELIATPFRFGGNRDKARRFFEHGLQVAFANICKSAIPGFPITVYYAFKQAEVELGSEDEPHAEEVAVTSTGWETMLEGLLKAGFLIDGTWPIRTERGSRSIGLGTNALASSIILVCRPRPKSAGIAARRDLLSALKRELPDALRQLQKGNIAPVDLAQAAIGPGMAVFSRYARVLETDGSPMSVRTALSLINQTLDEVLAEQEGEFDADTRWALAWFDQFGFAEGPYGAAETLSTAKNTSVSGMAEAGILTAGAGKVRLLRKEELASDWDPATANRFTIWEATHHLIQALDRKGEQGTADLMALLGGDHSERARDLTYRLFAICERRKWAKDAMPYNTLVQAWSEASRLATQSATVTKVEQGRLI